ncbi:MAG TPA: EAL domain-containing protein, partial [Allocoleopsis sp.]
CTQAAISLDNAKLYHNLQLSEAREREKSEQLAQAQTQLLYDAFHDSLTNLRNRTWFIHRLYQVMSLYIGNQDYLYAVLFLDLDRFKVINDSLGHLVGDELLKQVGIRLQNCLIDPQSIARLGGDEFAILLEGIKEVTQVIDIAKTIQQEFKKPFQLNQYQVYTEASIGITLSSMNYENPEDILRDADVAMYRAKSQGRGSYNIFNLSMQTKFQERLQLENDLRIALEKGEFYLNYQPIICLETGKIASFEALVRWKHPKKGFISPATFIPIAEETGLIMPLGWWVFTTACHQLNQWKKEIKQGDSLIMNINLSPLQLRQENLVNSMAMFLAEIELSSKSIKLEITESCLLDNVENQLQILQQMKDLGLQLCVDDFGTGYSSLNRLHEFPINTLKIDRSFVVSDRTETMQMIISLAHSLGMDVTAEGIETELQKQKLQDLGCEYLQGYLFSRPLNTQDATQFLINNL